MTRTTRQRLALLLSLILAALLFCQGMAQASVIGRVLPKAPAMPEMMACHMEKAAPAETASCPDGCLQIEKASTSDHFKPPVADLTLWLPAAWPPLSLTATPGISIPALTLSHASGDPPILLRSQRFRE